ncbi:MAG: biotin synthase, partial [Planctomycetota bacterium]
LQLRRQKQIVVDDLKKLRVAWKRTRAFVLTADHNPGVKILDRLDLRRQLAPPPTQLSLFETALPARSGEL